MTVQDKINANYYELDNSDKEEFFKDLCQEFGLAPNDKSRKLFDFAWQQGHSFGYQEVQLWWQDLLDLFNDLKPSPVIGE